MIKKIICSYMIVSALFAIALALNNVDNIQLGVFFRSYIVATNLEMNKFTISIPEIPQIPKFMERMSYDNLEWYEAILVAFSNFAVHFFNFLNGVINILNIVIFILNYVIQGIEFIVLLIKNFITMKDNIVQYVPNP